ncbi:hypothetical protein AS888_05475 [Peribacillus simplex]|uniref:Uncharacterized protein n=1 Tax=Peribacillus simplex TaxID=1478 RepID=A0A109N1T3_9BACI|nr:hypothetical protein AS888_05475 [Peribacillus simplex]
MLKLKDKEFERISKLIMKTILIYLAGLLIYLILIANYESRFDNSSAIISTLIFIFSIFVISILNRIFIKKK